MDLKLVQRHWNRLGQDDPLWAVLSLAGKQGGKWSEEEFFATGRAETRALLEAAARRGMSVARGRALDFGCGVGRLSQALAAEFERVDAVDIAPSMVERARGLNRWPARCVYHLNADPDLRRFADSSFDLVYSTLVLQHMAPEAAKAYIGEFCRVLAPGGLAVFQLPSDHATADPPLDAGRTIATAPLDPRERLARIQAAEPGEPVAAGSPLVLEVTVENRGRVAWPALGRFDSRFAVCGGGRWLDDGGRPLRKGSARCPLPSDLQPGQGVTLLLGINAPATNGEHVLELDAVQEHVAWFSETGSTPCRLRFVVEGGSPPPRRRPPLARRYPGTHRLLKAAGMGVVRRWLDRQVARSRRRARQLRDLWRRHTATTPIMEMNCVPRAEVEGMVSAAGGQLVFVDTHVLAGGFRSRVYWVRRRPRGAPG